MVIDEITIGSGHNHPIKLHQKHFLISPWWNSLFRSPGAATARFKTHTKRLSFKGRTRGIILMRRTKVWQHWKNKEERKSRLWKMQLIIRFHAPQNTQLCIGYIKIVVDYVNRVWCPLKIGFTGYWQKECITYCTRCCLWYKLSFRQVAWLELMHHHKNRWKEQKILETENQQVWCIWLWGIDLPS